MQRNLVIIPFAYLKGAKTGANLKRKDNPVDIYMKNVVVSTVSCKRIMGGVDVALITNLDEIGDEYQSVLDREQVKVIYCPFDSFKFSDDYPWCLAFYKLCALKYVSDLEYDNILCIDSDTYTHKSFEYLWDNLRRNIIAFDLAGSTVEPFGSLTNLPFVRRLYNKRVPKVGGEFLAASRISLKEFIDRAQRIFETMKTEAILSKTGDEYITSLALGCMYNVDYSGVRYIFRFWTGFWRDICNRGQLSVTPILHVPGNKKDGMIKLYNFFIRHNDFPPEQKMYKWFHFHHRTLKHFLLAIFKGTVFWQ